MPRLERLVVLCACLLVPPGPQDAPPAGYDDTPFLPGTTWRVHDARRPRPPRVEPGPTPGAPPSDAIVLFDGDDLDAWEGGPWRIVDGALEVHGPGDLRTREAFGDVQLHVEWRTPADDEGEGQGRGNSGVYLMGRYEIQVLDGPANPTYADGQAAALYGQHPPDVDASRPPGAWQSYDVVFEAPRFVEGELARPARVTVLHNGVLVHHARELLGATVHRRAPRYEPHPERAPLVLQDHGDPVRYRNVWVRRLDG